LTFSDALINIVGDKPYTLFNVLNSLTLLNVTVALLLDDIVTVPVSTSIATSLPPTPSKSVLLSAIQYTFPVNTSDVCNVTVVVVGADTDILILSSGIAITVGASENVISKVIKDSTVSRIKGCHMNERMKDAGEKFILRWLWTERGTNEDDSKVYNMDLIPSVPLIEELIAYHREGNFDRVMAMMQLMFMVEETYENEIHKEIPKNNAAEFLINQLDKMFVKK